MFLTYEDYTEKGGSLDRAKFNRFAFMAEKRLNEVTFNRLSDKEADETVKNCMYELILYFENNYDNGSSKKISSVSNDGYSVVYSASKSEHNETYNIIRSFFTDSDYLYSGLR